MNTTRLYVPSAALLLLLIFITSCNIQNKQAEKTLPEQTKKIAINTTTISYGEHDKVTSGLLDKTGNLWFGTSNEGAYRYDGKLFVHFTEQDGLSSNTINCLVEDRIGNLWFGTKKGLSKYDGKTFTSIPIPWDGKNDLWGENANPNVVQCLLEDKLGNLWFGTSGGGVYHFDGENFTNFTFDNDMLQSDGLHHNFIQSMIEDASGNIWFTSLTHGGVSRYDGTKFTHFSTKDGLKDDMIYSSFQDKTGNLWFGSIQTKYGGLYHFDGTSFTSLGKKDGLCDNFVTGFFEDRAGNLWIRTGSVLCMYDGKTFTPFTTADGKGLNDIGFIVEDKAQNIWLGGRYGHLWKYNGKTLTDFTQKSR